jgi:hypothetical protein
MFINTRHWRKAYMLEFLNGDVTEDIFTFAVPPESESFTFAQRVSETKTAGGSVFDDYGNDTIQIALSGTTINEERKIIYQGNRKPPKFLSGEKEIYELQKLFARWGESDKLSNKKLYLYDLSKLSLFQIATGAQGGGRGFLNNPSRNWWRVILKSFKIRRSKDRPFTYQYDLDFIGIFDEGKTREAFDDAKLVEACEKAQATMEYLQVALGYIETAGNLIDTGASALGEMRRVTEKASNGGLPLYVADSGIRVFMGGGSNAVTNIARSLNTTARELMFFADRWDVPFPLESTGRPPDYQGGYGNRYRYSSDNVVKVRFDTRGSATRLEPKYVAYGNNVSLPKETIESLQKDKYRFRGFIDTDTGEAFNAELPVLGEMVLYAAWEQTHADIFFESDGGSEVAPLRVAIGEVARAPRKPFKEKMALEGWYTEKEHLRRYYFNTPVTGDITLYAKWIAAFQCIFESNGGSAVAAQQYGQDELVYFPEIPERPGYALEYWSDDIGLGGEYDFSKPPNDNLRLYARWRRVYSEVIFESAGGLPAPKPLIIENGNLVPEPYPPPYKDGYDFLYWAIDRAGDNKFVFDKTYIQDDLTLYAIFFTHRVRVEYVMNGGEAKEDGVVLYERLLVYPETPVRKNYIFKRWCDDAALTKEHDFSEPALEDMILYAHWIKVSCTILFQVNGGEALGDLEVGLGTAAKLPTPKRVGFAFAGWYEDEGLERRYDARKPVVEGMVLYAEWSQNFVTLTFESNGGSAIDAMTIAQASVAMPPADPVLYAMALEAWYEDAGLTRPFNWGAPVMGNITLYARWTPIIVVLSFETNGGASLDDMRVAMANAATPPTPPERTGYRLTGWYKDAELTEEFDWALPVEESATLYAAWEVLILKVTFESDGGSEVAPVDVEWGACIDAPPEPVKDGSLFKGWYESADFSGEEFFTDYKEETDDDGNPTGAPPVAELVSRLVLDDLTLYARWERIVCRVTYESEGLVVGGADVYWGDAALRPSDPARAGWRFVEWREGGAAAAYDFSAVVTGDLTLYARWERIVCRVTYESEGLVVGGADVY